MNQASMVAHDYMHQAIKSIDDVFGEGYAEKHPSLIVGYMNAAALDFQASVISGAIGDLKTTLEELAAAMSD